MIQEIKDGFQIQNVLKKKRKSSSIEITHAVEQTAVHTQLQTRSGFQHHKTGISQMAQYALIIYFVQWKICAVQEYARELQIPAAMVFHVQ